MDVPNTLTRLGGGDSRALQTVPAAGAAFRQMAAAMLFTSSMAASSMWFALYDAVNAPVLVALLVAMFWGMGILVLDRTLMLLGMGSSRAGAITMAATRLLAAALIGVVVSTPLTLRIFASDINFELGQTQLTQGEQNKTALASSPEKKHLDEVQQEVSDWEDVRAGTLPARFASDDSATQAQLTQKLDHVKAQRASVQHTADQAAILYNCERYGGGRDQLDDPSKCAALPGPNGNAEIYHRQAVAAAAALAAAQAKVAAAQHAIDNADTAQQGSSDAKLAELQKQAPAKLEALATKLDEVQAAYDGLQTRLDDENTGNDGLLAQLTALWKAGEHRKGLLVAHLLLAALFILVEFLPVLSKLMWQFGRNGRAYEEAAESLDETGLAKAQSIRAQAQIEAETEFDVALLNKDTHLDEQRMLAEQRQDVMRIRHEAELRLERDRADDLAARQAQIDSEFGERLEAELRRRAEADYFAWEAAGSAGTVHFADFGPARHHSRLAPRTRWGAALRRQR